MPGTINATERWSKVDESLASLIKLLGAPRGNVSLEIHALKRHEPDQVVRLGERFVFEVSSKIDGRVIVVDINADGVVTQIFPNKFVQSASIGAIRTGETVRIPGHGYGFDWFRAAEPVGGGKLLVFGRAGGLHRTIQGRHPGLAHERF